MVVITHTFLFVWYFACLKHGFTDFPNVIGAHMTIGKEITQVAIAKFRRA
jgi:hypothetical protein